MEQNTHGTKYKSAKIQNETKYKQGKIQKNKIQIIKIQTQKNTNGTKYKQNKMQKYKTFKIQEEQYTCCSNIKSMH